MDSVAYDTLPDPLNGEPFLKVNPKYFEEYRRKPQNNTTLVL